MQFNIFPDLAVPALLAADKQDVLAQAQLTQDWTGPTKFAYLNLQLELKQHKDAALVEIDLHNNSAVSIGTIKLIFKDNEFGPAMILESLADTARSENCEALSPIQLQHWLDQTIELGALVKSTLGGTTDEICRSYAEAVRALPDSTPELREILEIEKEEEAIRWIDLKLPIPDSAAPKALLEAAIGQVIEADQELTALVGQNGVSGLTFLDMRAFQESLTETLKIDRLKLAAFIGPNILISVHDDDVLALEELIEESAAGTSAIQSNGNLIATFSKLAHAVLDENERQISRFEQLINNIYSDFERKEALTRDQIKREIPDLADDLRYMKRKLKEFQQMSIALAKFAAANGVNANSESQEDKELHESLTDLRTYSAALEDKVEHELQTLKDINPSNVALISMRGTQTQKRAALIGAITLPTILAANIIAIADKLESPLVASSMLLAGLFSAALIATAYIRKWF